VTPPSPGPHHGDAESTGNQPSRGSSGAWEPGSLRAFLDMMAAYLDAGDLAFDAILAFNPDLARDRGESRQAH
jgi:hypothetical protein